MTTFGNFQYHTYSVRLTGDEDEGWYRVVYMQGTTLISDRSIYPSKDICSLGTARALFENCVQHAIRATLNSMIKTDKPLIKTDKRKIKIELTVFHEFMFGIVCLILLGAVIVWGDRHWTPGIPLVCQLINIKSLCQ